MSISGSIPFETQKDKLRILLSTDDESPYESNLLDHTVHEYTAMILRITRGDEMYDTLSQDIDIFLSILKRLKEFKHYRRMYRITIEISKASNSAEFTDILKKHEYILKKQSMTQTSQQ